MRKPRMSDEPQIGEDGAALNKNHGTYLVPGLQRGLNVLEIVAAARKPLTVTEIADSLGVSRSSAFRLIYTLRYMGCLELSSDDRSYQLGARVLNLGFAFLNTQSIIQVARRDLEALRDATNVSAHLAIRDGRDVLFLDCVQARTGFQSNVNVGARLGAHASPLGWLLMSDIASRDIATLFKGATLEPLTDKTPVTLQALMEKVMLAATQGYIISRGFAEQGGCSVSAPVFNKDGAIVAAIDISGPDSAFDHSKFEDFYKPEVIRAAGLISERLGYSGN
ncbi:helix-turn-helix domain-containing protein [Alphaproteobacteria bacterium HT1-32]|nr:helix-turn-helix domain-containing protein [Alphaproteobacteria bacterium HT1-32]